jgi:N-acetylglucosaminyldiphosphoundecaprenol N-acetyl-beta-D-mannosaminyltransferase
LNAADGSQFDRDGSPTRVNLGGTSVDLLEECTLHREIAQRLTSMSDGALVIASANLDHVYQFGHGAIHADPASSSGVADWRVTLDGMPLVWAARVLTGTSWPQLAGSDHLEGILDTAEAAGARVAFLGGWPDQHRRLQDVLPRRWPALRVVGFWSPGLQVLRSADRSHELAEEIARSEVDLLVVGLGKPRQELWLAAYVGTSKVKVALAFGASSDFLAGMAQRAPRLWRKLGAEWLYRLMREPRRLWRRYLLQGPAALWRLVRWSGRPRSQARDA